MPDDVERNSFERWARNAVPQFSGAGKHIRDGAWSYNHNIVQLMWQCWNAARTPSPVSVEEVARMIYASVHHLMRVTGTDAQNAYESAARSIIAALSTRP
jgi:hypothetical protein